MSDVRTSILVQSALSGAVMGLVAGAVIFGAAIAIAMLLPESAERWIARARLAGILLCFILFPLAGALLGWLEGRLKL